jgi:hypothetical protein
MTPHFFVWCGENVTAKIYTRLGIEQYRSAQIFQKLRNYLASVGGRRVT